jgi:hypothetical protein
MGPLRARHQNGSLVPAKPLPLCPGGSVAHIFVHEPDPARWQLDRLASCSDEDLNLAAAGLCDWAASLGREDG